MTNLGIDLHFVESGYKSRERQINGPFDGERNGFAFRFSWGQSLENRRIIMPDASPKYSIFMIFKLALRPLLFIVYIFVYLFSKLFGRDYYWALENPSMPGRNASTRVLRVFRFLLLG